MKKVILILTILLSVVSSIFSESTENIISHFKDGDYYYDKKQYEYAIESYKQFWSGYKTNKNHFSSELPEDYKIDSNNTVQESYYSLYNIACCYSLLKNYDLSEYYLKYAVIAGYPYLNHILKDADLSNLFSEKKYLKQNIQALFFLGNNSELFDGKRIHVEGMDDITFCFFKTNDGKYKFTVYSRTLLDTAECELYGEGTFSFKNFKICLNYENCKKSYRDYANNLKTEKQITPIFSSICWYEIGSDMSSDFYFGKDWNGLYEKNKEYLIPVNSESDTNSF